MQTIEPQVFITNYQYYVNSAFLGTAISDSIKVEPGVKIPEDLYISIAYFTINRANGYNSYDSILALSIKGEIFKYKLHHNNADFFEANKAIRIDDFDSIEERDQIIRSFNSAFESLIYRRIEKIIDDLIAQYKID